MKIKSTYLIFSLLILLCNKLLGQNTYVLDSKLMVDCINCENPNNSPIFKIYLSNRYLEKSNIPTFAKVYYGDTTIDPFFFELQDSLEINCSKYFTYGPLYYTCETFGNSYPFKVFLNENCNFFNDSTNYKINFEIFVPSITLFNSSNIQILSPPPIICKHSNQINLSLIQSNTSSLFSQFELIKAQEDSIGILLNNQFNPTITINPKNLSPSYHSFKIKSYGQIVDSGGTIHTSESYHTFYLDTLIKPINWFDFTANESFDNVKKIISVSKEKDTIALEFIAKLNGYDINQLDFKFNVHNQNLNPINYEVKSIINDTIIGVLYLTNFNYPKKQYLSLTIQEKERCGLIFAENWELDYDTLTNKLVRFGKNLDFEIYPNPFNNVLNIVGFKNSEFELINTFGKVVYKDFIKNGINQFDIPYIPDGIYILKISTNNLVYYLKMLRRNS